ncbi:MAG TPA: ferredoxin [Acidimicrobiales bacterium]|nr:ferredoxin [Acidimicrobiales bacterium]
MRVWVDPERCQGHCRCVAVAEDLFAADDLGYAHAIGDGSVAPEQAARAQLAVNNCPEYAVILEP